MISLDWQHTDIGMIATLANGRQLASILPHYNRHAIEVATARNAYVPTIVHHVGTVHDGMTYVERVIAPQEAADTANVLSRAQFQALLSECMSEQLLAIVRVLGVDTQCNTSEVHYKDVLHAAYKVRANAINDVRDRLIDQNSCAFRFIQAVINYEMSLHEDEA